MGCQTGFYLLVRDVQPERVVKVVKSVLTKIINHEGEMFGASRVECGNYQNLSLDAAKRECKRYLDILLSKTNDLKYPEK